MNKINVMLDLETWSTSPNAVITSIGAVKFVINSDNTRGKIDDEFYCRINPQSCIDVGMEMSADTILWWMNQSAEARSEFQKPNRSIQLVLNDFSSWMSDEPKNINVWGNGSDFDNVILANAYKACKLPLPWKFFNNRCFRTLKNLYPDVEPTVVGVKHNALDDAKSQAHHLIDIITYINKTSVDVVPDLPKEKRIRKETIKVGQNYLASKKETCNTVPAIEKFNKMKSKIQSDESDEIVKEFTEKNLNARDFDFI